MPHQSQELRIRSLAAMARALGRSEELLRLLEIAAEGARTAMGAASVSVSRLVPEASSVQTLVNVGELGPGEVRWPEDEVYGSEDFAALRLVLDGLQSWSWTLADEQLPDSERALLEQLGKGSSLGAPLLVDGALWGEFYATRHRGEQGFDDVDAAYLEALLAILAGAVSRALREESLQLLAYRDALTGLPNRRALDEHAEAAFEVPAGRPRTVTAVTLDINRLKLVNDSLGHPAGDELISWVARDLQEAYRHLDGAVVARVGGDEFSVLVRDTDPTVVLAVSDELCRRTWPVGPGASVSAGAASFTLSSGTTRTPTDLFGAADRAQYVAKRGRLAVTVLSEEADHGDGAGGA